MGKEPVYRWSDSTVIAPLINHWPAWSYLISPAAASLHLLDYQLKTMRSYLQDPESHVRACKDPELIGGPFMDIEPGRAGDVRRLLAETERMQMGNLELARAIIDAYSLLADQAQGQELESFYPKLPYRLRGYVELVYDYYNHPVVRMLEGLLYESEYYDARLQSLKISRPERDNSRPFFMSTPCLDCDDEIDWAKPFNDPQADWLFSLDVEPQPLGIIRETLGLSEKDEPRLMPMLSQGPASPPEKWQGADVRIRYFGHACVLAEWRGISILTDPFVSAMPTGGGIERLTYRDLPAKIDYALVTHNHCDHFVLETLLRLRHRIGHLVVPRSFGLLHGDVSLKLMCRQLGFKNVIEMDTLERIELGDGKIVAVPFLGEHGDLPHAKTAYVVRAGNQAMMFAADSNCLDRHMYERVRDCVGDIETVFLGTESVGAPLSWSYGPLFPRKPSHGVNQSRRQRGCDAARALDLLEAVGARRVYNYGMGQEPWLEHILALGLTEDSPQICESDKLLAEARRRGFIAAERLFGKREFYLEESAGEPRRPSLGVPRTGEDQESFDDRPSLASEVNDAEDTFVF